MRLMGRMTYPLLGDEVAQQAKLTGGSWGQAGLDRLQRGQLALSPLDRGIHV